MLRLRYLLLSLLTWHQFSPANTDTIALYFPVECYLGTNCFIQNYVDTDPTSDYRDYTCGFLSYDGHKGTDFRIPDLTLMKQGVKVLAAAPGRVRATRDEMPDINIRDIDPALIKGREAGNSVVIVHKNGWETQYSHLRRGSVLVKPGDQVFTGQPLGLVGLSGNTEFPHLHFTVRYKKEIIDPFTGLKQSTGCGLKDTKPLWDKSFPEEYLYIASGILNGGFTDTLPKSRPYYEYLKIKQTLSQTSDTIIFWVHTFGLQKDDIQTLKIFGPKGKLVTKNNTTLKKNEAQRLAFLGGKKKKGNWPTGTYRGEYTLGRYSGDKLDIVVKKIFTMKIEHK